MDWQGRLVRLYLDICVWYREELWVYCQRLTPYANLDFTDEEAICVYLWGIMDKRREIKELHKDARRHLKGWFPTLPGYSAYVDRLNQLSGVFAPLAEKLQVTLPSDGVLEGIRLMDSMPVVMAQGPRRYAATIAKDEIANSGYCASKKMYYHGVKLHVLGLRRPGSLPVPAVVGLTPAGDHDLVALRHIAGEIEGGELYLDKAYIDAALKQAAKENKGLDIYTPVKKKRGEDWIDLFGQCLSTAVSSVRQPIESFFNWIQQKTGIQCASKVRSYRGLLVHVFGRLAAAFYLMKTELA